MDTIQDFADLLEAFARNNLRYLIVGGLAFIYHATPRFTKDMDVWVEPTAANLEQVNRALAEFGRPNLLDTEHPQSMLQIGLPPSRIDILQTIEGASFEKAWSRREISAYGPTPANWVDLDTLIDIKAGIDDPRHQADARDLRKVRGNRERSSW